MRALLDRRSAIGALIGALLIGGAVYYIASFFRPVPVYVTYDYFYDLGSGEVFVADSTLVAPFPAPSGKSGPRGEPLGVEAAVFSCGDCSDPQKRYLGYLQQYLPEAQKKILEARKSRSTNPEGPIDRATMEGDLRATEVVVRSPDVDEWFRLGTEGSDIIMSEARSKCHGPTFPVQCFPPRYSN